MLLLLLLLAGVAAVVTGTALLSWPAALIVGGAFAVAAAIDLRS